MGALALMLLMCWPAEADEWLRILQVTSEGSEGVAVAVSPSSPNVIYFASRAPFSGLLTSYRSRDTGSTWTAFPPNGGPPITIQGLAVDPSDPLVAYATTSEGVLKTVDGAEHWTAKNAGLPANTHVFDRIVVDPHAPSTLHAATGRGIFESLDGGATWFSASNGLPNPDGSLPIILSIAADPSNASVLYAGSTNSVFKTTDGGSNWLRTWESAININAIAVDTGMQPVVYAATGYRITTGPHCFFNFPDCSVGAVLRSADGGMNWASSLTVPSNSPFKLIAIDPGAPSVVWAGSDNGLFQSLDGGSSWTTVHGGLTEPPLSIAVVPGSPTVVYVGTNSGLFLKRFADDGSPLCSDGVDRLCMQGRFRVSVDWLGNGGGGGPATAVPLTSNTGAFWFFDPTNLELVVKVLDGRSINGKWWVFYGSLTNVEFTLTVTDTVTGAVKTYINPQGQLASVADTSAF